VVDQRVLDEYATAVRSLAEHAADHRRTATTIDEEWSLPDEGPVEVALERAREAWAAAERALAEAQDELRRVIKRRLGQLEEGR